MRQLGWRLLRLIFGALSCAGLAYLAYLFLHGAAGTAKAAVTLATGAALFLLFCAAGRISPPPGVDGMTGPEFEAHCAGVLKKEGFRQIRSTPATGDYGADLIARDRRGRRWVFQCKRYAGKVGNAAVQEVVAAKAHYGADCAGVMTNSSLTGNARQLADENGVLCYEHIR